MSQIWMEMMRPLQGVLPRITPPAKEWRMQDKAQCCIGVLVCYLIASKVPLYGQRLSSADDSDPLSTYRMMLASNRGSLMELGISPLVTASMLLQALCGMKIVNVDRSNADQVAMYELLEKFCGFLVIFLQAIFYCVISGIYGSVWELGIGNVIIIMFQLCASGFFVTLWDDLLQKGYGFGSAISLFISCNICETIVWNAFSYQVIETVAGPKFEGAVVNLVYQLTMGGSLGGIKEAFFRTDLPNVTSLVSTVVVFVVVIYFQGFRVDIPIKHTQVRSGAIGSSYPIKLFYTSTMPIMIQSNVTNAIMVFSSSIFDRFGRNPVTWLLGVWTMTPYGRRLPVAGFCYYISAPSGLPEIFRDPLHFLFYSSYMLFSCAIAANQWLQVSGSSAKEVSNNLKSQGMTVVGYRPETMHIALNRYIPPAAVLGGFAVGGLTIFSDFMGALGSGTSILLAVGNMLQMVEQAQKQAEKDVAESAGGVTGFSSLFR